MKAAYNFLAAICLEDVCHLTANIASHRMYILFLMETIGTPMKAICTSFCFVLFIYRERCGYFRDGQLLLQSSSGLFSGYKVLFYPHRVLSDNLIQLIFTREI